MTTLSLFSLLDEEDHPAPVLAPELTSAQREAVERRDGSLFVHAGAGSGKTRVLVERFVRAVIDDGVAVEPTVPIGNETAPVQSLPAGRTPLLHSDARPSARKAKAAPRTQFPMRT